MLNIHELNVFVEAAEVENFSIAAHRLYLSQPAVSLQIRNLEKQLGVDLFRRNGRNVSLSDAGKVLLPMAQDLLRQTRHVEEAMWGLQGLVIGEVSIACSTAVGKYLLPGVIAGFRRHFTEVQVMVKVVNRRMAADWLIAGRAEIAVVSREMAHRDLELRPLLEDQIILIVPADHPWADGRTIVPTDLLTVPLIMDDAAADSYEVLDEGLAANGMSVADLRPVMTLGSAEAIAMAVEAGIGAAFIPRIVAARGLALGCMREVPIRDLPLQRTICLARNVRRVATPPEQAFWDFTFDPANESIRLLPFK